MMGGAGCDRPLLLVDPDDSWRLRLLKLLVTSGRLGRLWKGVLRGKERRLYFETVIHGFFSSSAFVSMVYFHGKLKAIILMFAKYQQISDMILIGQWLADLKSALALLRGAYGVTHVAEM